MASEMGFTHVSLSSSVMPMIRVVPRGYTGKYHAFFVECSSFDMRLCLDMSAAQTQSAINVRAWFLHTLCP